MTYQKFLNKKINLNRKKGILFWITGLSGSGKTTIAKKIKKKISKLYGPTIEISGDELRGIFKLNKPSDFSHKSRLKNLWIYCELCKLITDKKINLIFNTMRLYNRARVWNRKNFDNYIEIYIEADIEKILSQKKKEKHLSKKRNVVGYDIKAEFPKNPHIKVINDFSKNLNEISKEVLKKIKKIL